MPTENDRYMDAQALGRELYMFLSTKGLLKIHPDFDIETEWEIKEQSNVQGAFAARMLYLFESKNHRFFKLCREMDLCIPLIFRKFREESKLIPFALLANSALPQYETLKRCLLFALDLEVLGLGKTSKITYGMIINKLEQHDMASCIATAMDNELRNIIAHGSWYVKGNKFTYVVKEKTFFMSYENLKVRTSNFSSFTNGFFDSYWIKNIRKEHITFAFTKMFRDVVSDRIGT